MKKRRKKDEGHPNHERWLLSYVDFITVLMIFFIVMYAMSTVDATKYQKLSQSLNDALGGGKSLIGSELPPISVGDPNAMPEVKQMEDIKAKVDEYLKENGLAGKVNTNIDERGLVISLQDTVLFASGSDKVEDSQRVIISKIGAILKDTSNYIRVEGHTDNVPIRNAKFSSNWMLSSARSCNVVEVLITDSKISETRLSSLGYGEHRPIADNATVEGKAKNRRVDVIVLNSKYNETEHNTNKKVNTNVPSSN